MRAERERANADGAQHGDSDPAVRPAIWPVRQSQSRDKLQPLVSGILLGSH
jgi:hypothetical protein